MAAPKGAVEATGWLVGELVWGRRLSGLQVIDTCCVWYRRKLISKIQLSVKDYGMEMEVEMEVEVEVEMQL